MLLARATLTAPGFPFPFIWPESGRTPPGRWLKSRPGMRDETVIATKGRFPTNDSFPANDSPNGHGLARSATSAKRARV